MNRINEKITELEEFLEQLSAIAPESLEAYKSNLEKKAACERYFEKIAEAITDIAFLIIKLKKWRIPQDDNDAFTVLGENKAINEGLVKKLQDAKGMRNILAHEYGRVNDALVFTAIKEELEEDARGFINNVNEVIKNG